MAIVTKTIKGRRYRYSQRSFRVGRKVKTISTYLGPAEFDAKMERAMACAERHAKQVEAYQLKEFGITAAQKKEAAPFTLKDLNKELGLGKASALPAKAPDNLPTMPDQSAQAGNPQGEKGAENGVVS